MARTAPVPNIPPIPGMDPGMLVLAGNGDGGGGGGKGAKGGGGKDGADGDKGKDDPNGDGKGGKCGGGGPQKCSDHEGAAAGDPIDVASGRVYTQLYIDVAWPGPLPFSFRRKYSSNLNLRDVGLGFGWTHSYAWTVEVRGRAVEVWDEDGARELFELPEMGFSSLGEKRSVLVREPGGFTHEKTQLIREFEPADASGKRFRLKSMRDSRKNTITLAYDSQGRLAQIVDSVGRVLRVRSNAQGRIAALEAPTAMMGLVTFAQYRYDERHDLVSATDPEQGTARFTYFDDHLLASHTQPGALTFHYRYDDKRRGVETWGIYDNGALPGLAADAPKLLADGQTRAKGILHAKINYYPDGYREVIDSMSVRRFMGNIAVSGGKVTERYYDDAQNLIHFVDQLGKSYFWTWDENGSVLSESEPNGNVTRYKRDHLGREVEVSDNLGTIAQFGYDQWNNATDITYSLGETTSYKYDWRGLPTEILRPDGTRVVREYDAHGNQLSASHPDGSIWRWTYDEFGNETSVTDPNGAVTRYYWNLKRELVAKQFADGNTIRFDYSSAGDCIVITDGTNAARVEYDGMHQPIRRTFGDGSTLNYRYNRESYLTEIVNERGQLYKIDPNEDGKPIKVVSFNGRVLRYKYDALGRLLEYEDGNGARRKMKRDEMGQVVEEEFADGSKDTYEYDLRGQLLRASTDTVVLSYELNAAGLELKETQAVGGLEHYVERTFDPLRERKSFRTSLGHHEQVERDLDGMIAKIALDGQTTVGFERDGRGQERRRVLPGGAYVETDYNPRGLLVKRALHSPHASAPRVVGPAEPDWVGPRDPSAAILKAFRYGAELLGRYDSGRGTTDFEYDTRSRLLSVTREGRNLEAFRHDPTNNLFEAGGRRVYGSGNELLEKDGAVYRWDSDGQLVEKRIAADDGAERVFNYEWDAKGNLRRVATPDGLDVEFDYDPFARRMSKRVTRERADGTSELVLDSRFVWDGPRITHEIRRQMKDGVTIVEEKTYAYANDRGLDPLAQRRETKSDTGPTKGDWLFFVNDVQGTPEQIVTGDGRIVGDLERSAYGRTKLVGGTETTDLRLPGQWEDPETGLFYNRYRYYDPDAGRYISEDPAGDLPDPNLFRYTTNPITSSDPDGLHEASWTWTPKGAKEPTKSGKENSSFDADSYKALPSDSGLKQKVKNGQPVVDKNGDAVYTPKSKQKACGSDFNTDRTSDTEAKITRDRMGNSPDHEGGKLDIKGQQPPCPHCHKKMKEWASNNKATVNYSYPKNSKNTITYHPDGSVTTSTKTAAAIVADRDAKLAKIAAKK